MATRRKREADLKQLEAKTKELANMSSAEKQKIVMQISSVQTELQQVIDSRDSKMRDKIVARLDECDAKIKAEVKHRAEAEKELKKTIETSSEENKLYADESVDSLRKMTAADRDVIRARIVEIGDSLNVMDLDIAALKSELGNDLTEITVDKAGRDKVLEAKIEDLSDRLRLGMNKLQVNK